MTSSRRPQVLWNLLSQARADLELDDRFKHDMTGELRWLFEGKGRGVASVRIADRRLSDKGGIELLLEAGLNSGGGQNLDMTALVGTNSATVYLCWKDGQYGPVLRYPGQSMPNDEASEAVTSWYATFEVPSGLIIYDGMPDDWLPRDQLLPQRFDHDSLVSKQDLLGWIAGGVLGNAAWALLIDRYKALKRSRAAITSERPGVQAADELLTLMIRQAVHERAKALKLESVA